MDGAEIKLGRLFDRESGRSFVAAFDHGLGSQVALEGGPVEDVFERIIGCEPDGVLISPGNLRRCGHLFAFRGAPSPILRADFFMLEDRIKEFGERHRVICTPEEAANLGADAVVMFLLMGVSDGEIFADNARAVANAAQAAHRAGIPLIVEMVLWGSRVPDKRDPDLLAYGCRMAAELGADAIKTEYTGDPGTMASVVEGCPVPVLTLGGPRTDSEEALIEATRGAMEAGAKGVVYGRNIWQADDPRRVSAAIREAVHGVYAGR